jgi:hypothetical protein
MRGCPNAASVHTTALASALLIQRTQLDNAADAHGYGVALTTPIPTLYIAAMTSLAQITNVLCQEHSDTYITTRRIEHFRWTYKTRRSDRERRATYVT